MESDSPRLLKTFTSVKGVSSLLEGSKYMLLNLASIYGTRVKELIRQQILSYSKDIYTEKGIATQVRTFQKLSIDIIDFFGESLISTFRYFRFKLYHCIISKFLMFCKGIKFTCMGFLVLLCAHYANADETELIPLKNELKALITEQEELHKIPSGLLLAIATVESGSKPYALNIQGKSVIGRNKREAVALIHEALANGITNIDVGVMQLNVRWHRENFGSIEEMLEPKKI